MKLFTRGMCLLLALLVIPFTALAAEAAEPRASAFFAEHGAYIDVISSSKIEVWFNVTAVGTMDVIGAKTIKIQRSSDRVNWTTVATYSKDSYTNMVDTDTGFHGSYITYSGVQSGYYYRAKVTFYAKNSSGTGEYTLTTSIIP